MAATPRAFMYIPTTLSRSERTYHYEQRPSHRPQYCLKKLSIITLGKNNKLIQFKREYPTRLTLGSVSKVEKIPMKTHDAGMTLFNQQKVHFSPGQAHYCFCVQLAVKTRNNDPQGNTYWGTENNRKVVPTKAEEVWT